MASVNDVYAIRTVCWEPGDSQVSINVFHYFVSFNVGIGGTDLQIAQAFDVIMFAAYKQWMANVAQYRGVGATKIWPLPRQVEATTNVNNGPGTGGAVMLPAQTSGLIKFTTPFAGRTHRGRCYPGFPPATFSDNDGKMNAAGGAALAVIRTALPNTFNAPFAGPNVSTLIQCVYNRTTHAVTGITGYTSYQSWAKIGRAHV
jgi:hypothetical protein